MAQDRRLSILFTNNALDTRGGTEMVTLDLATEFRRRGHYPVAYSLKNGQVAMQLRENCIPVVNALSLLGDTPDIIHGHHHLEAMTAMLYFPATPAIYVCHGWFPWEELPPIFSNIIEYVAVGEVTRNHVSTTCSVPRDRVSIVPNFVDLEKFQIKQRFNEKPLRAAIFGNSVTHQHPIVPAIARACQESGLQALDLLGYSAGHPVHNPETALTTYDIVFAVGRCAIEAMSVGCAVILSGDTGIAEMMTPENLDSYFGRFGATSLRKEHIAVDFLKKQIARYSPQSAREVAEKIRPRLDMRQAADQYENIYYSAIEQYRQRATPPLESDARFRDAANYVARLSIMLKESKAQAHQMNRLLVDLQKNKGRPTNAL